MIGTDVYQVNVTWDPPEHRPDFYNVSLNMHSDGDIVSQNVSGVCARNSFGVSRRMILAEYLAMNDED